MQNSFPGSLWGDTSSFSSSNTYKLDLHWTLLLRNLYPPLNKEMMINKCICMIINKTISQLGRRRVKDIRFRLMINASDVAHHSLVSVRTVNINGCFSETACKFLISNPCNTNSLVPSKYKFNIGKINWYGLYIRLFLELFQLFLVSGINEVYYIDVSDKYRIISFAFAVAILIIWFWFTLFVAFFSISSYIAIEGQHNKLNEFFSGLKINKRHRFSVAILLIRRSFFVIFLFACYSISSKVVIGVLSLFQLSYLVYLIIIRPFIEIKANVIEIINESIFLFLLSALFFLNTENDWTPTIAIVYMQIIWQLQYWSIMILLKIASYKINKNKISYIYSYIMNDKFKVKLPKQ